jgi:hypothetical protein
LRTYRSMRGVRRSMARWPAAPPGIGRETPYAHYDETRATAQFVARNQAAERAYWLHERNHVEWINGCWTCVHGNVK